MKRFLYNQLTKWKERGSGRVLIVSGLPGVGKRDLVEAFCSREFKSCINIKPTNLYDLSKVVNEDIQEEAIVFHTSTKDINLLKGIINIQELYKNKFIIVIDSFIRSFKEGNIKADYLILRPLSFEEFIYNTNSDLFLRLSDVGSIDSIDPEMNQALGNCFSDYLFVGGMKDAVEAYIVGEESSMIREIQNRLLKKVMSNIEMLFPPVVFKNMKHILELIFPTLIRDNRKFKFSDISVSRRYNSLREYFNLVQECNLVYRSNIVHDSNVSINEKAFILYFFDTGILGAIGEVPRSLYNYKNLLENPITTGIVNNYVSTEMKFYGLKDIYFWSHNLSKIEFLFESRGKLYPMEIKSNSSGKLKSYDSFNKYFKCENNFRFNMENKKGSVTTLPIYSLGLFVKSLVISNKNF